MDRPAVLDRMMLHFRDIQIFNSAIPNDYQRLKQDDSFYAAVSHYHYSFVLAKRFYEPIIKDVNGLILHIEKELRESK